MVAVRSVLLLCVYPVVGAVLRHAAGTSHAKGAEVDKAKTANNVEDVHRVAGLLDVERDLETDKKKDDSSLRDLETQIVSLVHKRDAAKRDEARKDREIAFLQNQIGRSNSGTATAARAEVAQETATDAKAAAATEAADQVVQQAESTETVAVVKVDRAAQRAKEEAVASAAAAATARAAAEQKAEAEQKAAAKQRAAAALAAKNAAAAKAAAAATAAAAAQQESRAAFEARIRAEAEEKAMFKMKAEQEAMDRVRAAAEAKARVKLAAEQKLAAAAAAKAAAEQKAKVDAQNAAVAAQQRQKNNLAEHADDSFKQFMKEENEEDNLGDADYEDSANALAGAIGWNRQEIESKADASVKALTEAIGGKKVVQSLQGMMAGVR